jgi:hypothetical protein
MPIQDQLCCNGFSDAKTWKSATQSRRCHMTSRADRATPPPATASNTGWTQRTAPGRQHSARQTPPAAPPCGTSCQRVTGCPILHANDRTRCPILHANDRIRRILSTGRLQSGLQTSGVAECFRPQTHTVLRDWLVPQPTSSCQTGTVRLALNVTKDQPRLIGFSDAKTASPRPPCATGRQRGT